jgi:hypothetical protein
MRMTYPLSLIAAAMFLSGCFQTDERRAGVDDFPNSIYARVSGFMDEGKKADSLQPVPAAVDTMLSAQVKVPLAKAAAGPLPTAPSGALWEKGLAKLTAGEALSPACKGVFTFASTRHDSLFGVVKDVIDSASFCVNVEPTDTVKRIVRWKTISKFKTGRVEISEMSDADGDSLINPVAGREAKVLFQSTIQDSGWLQKSLALVGPGPDANFDAQGDNLTYEALWIRTQGGDTLGMAAYTDADGDGIAVDNAKPSDVRLTFYQKGPTQDDPHAVWGRITLVMTVRYQVDAKVVKRFQAESEDDNGRLNTAIILNRAGGEDIDMRDTLEARFVTVGTAAADTLDTLRTTLVMSTGKDFDAKTDDSVFAIHVVSKKKGLEEKSATFDFVSDKPILSGQEAKSGELAMHIDYTDGTFIDVAGKITETTVDVTAAMRDGKRVHAVWDRKGNGISIEHLN